MVETREIDYENAFLEIPTDELVFCAFQYEANYAMAVGMNPPPNTWSILAAIRIRQFESLQELRDWMKTTWNKWGHVYEQHARKMKELNKCIAREKLVDEQLTIKANLVPKILKSKKQEDNSLSTIEQEQEHSIKE